MADTAPVFSAVSSNAHHLYTLLQCIGFAPKATVQITPDGIRFAVEEGRVIQGLAFLDKALFTTYSFNPPAGAANGNEDAADNDDSSGTTYYPHFVISLSALLETLKIFGINDASASNSSKPPSAQQSRPMPSNAFTTPALLLDRSCTLQYSQPGSPLSVTLSETGVKTTCELTTYEPEDDETDIPLQRDAIIMKIIMRSAWLHNAITELDSTNPTVLKVSASAKREPFFALSGSGGPFSESVVEFSVDQQNQNNGSEGQSHHKIPADDGSSRPRAKGANKLAPTVTETFLVSPPSSMGSRIKQDYRFPLIRKASRAMAAASKVSIRGDKQGVLSLQFMIDFEEGAGANPRPAGGAGEAGGSVAGSVAFVDFRFVPLLDENETEDG
ncbi:hypothetical protein PHISP_04190 [Aspergillus sp. HF37]|nr:hypothetical protein PHISP_04190 [Aspergillus sp. HF37]